MARARVLGQHPAHDVGVRRAACATRCRARPRSRRRRATTAGSGGGQRAHDADADAGHDARRLAAGEQGDLRVPRLHRQGRLELEGVGAVALLHHLLLRAPRCSRRPAPARGRAGAGRSRAGGPATGARHPTPANAGPRRTSARRDSAPWPGRTGSRQAFAPASRSKVQSSAGRSTPGSRLAAPSPSVVGVERRPAVGQVQRDAACERLAVERAAGGDEGGDVGDRVVHAVAGAGAFGVERLIEVAAAGRVDGHQVEVARVEPSLRRLPVAAGGRRAPARAASAITSASKPVGTARSCRTRAKSSASSAADAASRSGASVNVRRDAGERGPRCCRGRRDRARRGMPARPPCRRPR